MAAIAVSLATSLTSAVVPSSLTSFVFNKLNSAPCLRVTFSVSRFSSYRGGGKLMAHSLVRATLGLTQPANIDVPKVFFLLSCPLTLIFPLNEYTPAFCLFVFCG